VTKRANLKEAKEKEKKQVFTYLGLHMVEEGANSLPSVTP
jgi:hypothetical protein